MFNLLELYRELKTHLLRYQEVLNYANGNMPYPVSPYMQNYYKSLLPSLSVHIRNIQKQIKAEANKIGVKS